MIVINNLQKKYGNMEVLTDINLKIEEGDIYGLVGMSGAGKSTLLRCINGLETYSGGSLKVVGTEVKDLNKNDMKLFRKNIGMIFQNFPMLSRKTVYENIAYPMRCWKYDKNTIDMKVRDLAEIVGITDKLYQKPGTLSGGQKQRVAIARALTMNPRLLLSDEATSALDPMTTKSILELLDHINKEFGITIVVVTHQMNVVREICKKVSLLGNGKIVASGEVTELFLKEPDALRNFLGQPEFIKVPEGVNIQLMLLDDGISRKILNLITKELDVEYLVVGGKMEQYRDKNMGDLIINVQEVDAPKVKSFLDKSKVTWFEYN